MITLILSGLATGAVYALVAIGYNIVFVSSKTFNFAHAQFMMVGAFVAYAGIVLLNLPAILAALIAAVAVGLLALAEYYSAIRPVRDVHSILVTTLGASILLDGATQLVAGPSALQVPFFAGNNPITFLGGQAFPVEIGLIILVIVIVAAFVIYGRFSLTGLALRGMSEDREAAQLRGINVRRLALGAFIFSGLLAGAVGVFVGPQTYAVATLGASFALKGFVVLAIGGFGSMPGTLIGGAVVGLAEAFAARYFGSTYANLTVFVILIAILLIKPGGLFVRTGERAV
jgi:branched-chain amino acid transport system permease protein